MMGIFRGKVHGTVTVGERGQVVIPADIRKSFGIKAGDKLIVMAKQERKMIGLIPTEDFNRLLTQVSEFVSKMEKKISNRKRR